MPVEHLRSKKSEAQSLVQSRKRKLNQLFSISIPVEDPTYRQKLQAFHDANDLEKGRRFDETTLPPRSHIVLRSRKSTPKQPHTDLSPKAATLQQPTLTPKNVTSSSPATKSAPKPVTSSQISSLTSKSPGEDERDGDQALSHEGGDGTERKGSASSFVTAQNGEDSTLHVLSDGDRGSKSHSPPLAKVPPTIGKPVHLTEPPGILPASSTESNPADTLAAASGPRSSRSPPLLAPAQAPADPQSSPASSDGPDSSNTPAPDAASPGTSPGVDLIQPTSVASESRKAPVPDYDRDTPGNPHREDARGKAIKAETTSVDVQMAGTDDDGSASSNPDHLNKLSAESTLVSSTQRPAMRIDTRTESDSYFRARLSSGIVESPAQLTSTTPRRNVPATPSAEEPTKRATRISSGVLQKKSVSEILGETPRTTTPQAESPRDSFGATTPQGRMGDRDRRDKDRSRLSTVVFAKREKAAGDEESMEVVPLDGDAQRKSPGERDYLYTLFENKAHSMSRQTSMSYLIQNAHKTLSTSDHLVEYELSAECRILKRLYQLQEKQRWALRQHKRAEEAPRPTSHWDFLLDHMKWMRTDFREERKWKIAAARGLAECCAEWVASSPEERKQLQVRVRPPKVLSKPTESQEAVMEDAPGASLSSQPTPELVPSNEDDSMSDDIVDLRDVQISSAPAAIFSLGASDFNYAVDRTPALDKLLDELPLYGPTTIEPVLSRSELAGRLDAKWRTDVVPVSRWATEKLPVIDYKPPAKRSRYDYELEPSPRKASDILPPEETNVALFMPENKIIRDRIHPGHSFRPPSEHPMPTQAFFETRSSSQWTAAEDDELKRLVKDYSYNWSLISSCLTPPSLYTSGADRRTPWECFERWIGLEGLPADMSKTAYFKTYSGRIEAAGRHVAAQIEEAQRRAGANVQISARRRTTQPVKVERKRTQRHLAMLDAMRKLAKKRETALQKQQHQADLAAMRKVNDANVPKPSYKTPAEFSQLKQEREQKLAERQEIYRQQLIAHQRATAQQQRGQSGQANGVPNGMPAATPGMRAPSGGSMPGMPNGNMQMPNGHRPHPAMIAAMQGNMPLPPGMMAPKITPQMQAQMQAQMAARGGMTSPQQIRILQEATRVQQEQLMRQAQQAQNGPHSSPNNAHAALANGQGMSNAAYRAAMAAAANGNGSPSNPMNGSSPRSNNANSSQALSSGHIPVLTQIANKIREHHPNLSDEEVQRLASQQLQTYQHQATQAAAGHTAQKRPQPHNQAALNAALGAVNAGNNAQAAAVAAAAAAQLGHPGMMTNEQVQQYNQRIRMQQAQQHAQRNLQAMQMQQQMGGAMANVNGMATSPVMNMARPVSQHANPQGQMSRSATPRDQRSSSQSNGTGNGQGQQGSPRQAAQSMQT
ncbi:RNA polymerase II transcription elongation factor SpEAF [Cladophialophora chaetospira]|uniref:Vacuolar import and degradation protein 21 n=1 Tax=Cladophialophora chaetospira TaxID=386627 RepID=A0AA38X3F9_9EURO|nr:RNA polymerase II transcription elongation factor SpEAF [Cladophialophora chaetospira]